MTLENRKFIYQFHVPGIMCASCTGSIDTALSAFLQSSTDYSQATVAVSVATKTAYVEVENELKPEAVDSIRKVIEECGFVDVTYTMPDKLAMHAQQSIRPQLWRALLGCAAGAISFYLAMTGLNVPMMVMNISDVIAMLVTGYLSWDTLYKAKQALQNKKLNMYVLFMVNTFSVMIASVVAWFLPLPRLMYTALLLYGFKNIGEIIEKNIHYHITKKVSFRERAAKQVEYLDQGVWKQIKSDSVDCDKIIRLMPGMINPFDGECENAEASVYEEILNGDPYRLISKKRGDKVLAGARVAEDMDYLLLKVKKKEYESYLARKDKQLLLAEMERSTQELAMEGVMRYFVPFIFALSAVVGFCFGWVNALSVMVGICPCVISTIIPLSLSACRQKAADLRVLFTSDTAIFKASEITAIVFDRNYTLTTGQLSVARHDIFAQMDKNEFCDIVYALEQTAKHPIAAPICEYVKKEADGYQFKYTDKLEKVTHRAGVSAHINDKEYFIGNQQFMREQGCVISKEIMKKIEMHAAKGYHVMLVANKQSVLGCLLINDPLRDGAKYTINYLQKSGIKVYMATGSDEVTARATAKKLGIPFGQVKAGCKDAADKLKLIEELEKAGHKVAMVGDGANDTDAMSHSLGVLVRSPLSESAEQAASVVIDDETLYPVASMVSVARQMQYNKWFSLALTGVYNTGIVMMICCSMMSTVTCMAAMFTQSIIVKMITEIYKRYPMPHLTSLPAATAVSQSWYSTSKRLLEEYFPAPKPNISAINDLPLDCQQKVSENGAFEKAKVAELVDALDLGSSGVSRESSSLSFRT